MENKTDDEIYQECLAGIRRAAREYFLAGGVPEEHVEQVSRWFLEHPPSIEIPELPDLDDDDAPLTEEEEEKEWAETERWLEDKEGWEREKQERYAEMRARLGDTTGLTAREVFVRLFEREPDE